MTGPMTGSQHASASGLTLRDATPQDAPVITEIYNQSVRAGDATMDREPKTARQMRRMIAGFGPRETILMLEQGDAVLGWGIIKRYSDRSGYRFTCETSVYLWRDRVGAGHGSRIKRALIERCRQYGYHHLVAKIFAQNAASIEYNRKFGYELVGIQREVGHCNGRWQDIAILQLVLGDVAPREPATPEGSGP